MHWLLEKPREQMQIIKERVCGREEGEELIQQRKEMEPWLNGKRKRKDARSARKSQCTSPEKRMFPKDGNRRAGEQVAGGEQGAWRVGGPGAVPSHPQQGWEWPWCPRAPWGVAPTTEN